MYNSEGMSFRFGLFLSLYRCGNMRMLMVCILSSSQLQNKKQSQMNTKNSKEKVAKKIVLQEDKTFHFRYKIHRDLIQAFLGYMTLFKRYCLIVKNRKIYFDINQEEEELIFELGISEDCDLNLSRKYLDEFLGFVINKDNLLGLSELVEGETDGEELKILQMRLLEQRKHLLIVIRLEFGLRNIVEFSKGSILSEADIEEIERVKNTYELEIRNYETLVKLIKSEEENKHLLKSNITLQHQIKKIEAEKDILIKQIVNVVNDKIINAEKVVSGKADKEELEKLVGENKMKEVFSLLKLTGNLELKTEVILLQNQWHELQKISRLGMVSVHDFTTANSRITLAVLEIIKKI